jgi:hypothetical protein
MILLLAPVSARALNNFSSLLMSRLTTNSEVGCEVFASLLDLVLVKLEKKGKYSSSSSLVVVKLISVERRDSVFLFLEFGIFVFNCFFNELISSKRKANDFFREQAWSQYDHFCAVWPLQWLCSRPYCGCFCHSSDTTFLRIFSSSCTIMHGDAVNNTSQYS